MATKIVLRPGMKECVCLIWRCACSGGAWRQWARPARKGCCGGQSAVRVRDSKAWSRFTTAVTHCQEAQFLASASYEEDGVPWTLAHQRTGRSRAQALADAFLSRASSEPNQALAEIGASYRASSAPDEALADICASYRRLSVHTHQPLCSKRILENHNGGILK